MDGGSPPTTLYSLESASHANIVQPGDWHPILESSSQVVLYNPASHALTVTSIRDQPLLTPTPEQADTLRAQVLEPEDCPLCHRPMLRNMHERHPESSRVPNYFHLLAIANETVSRPGSPSATDPSQRTLGNAALANGYFAAFFREERRLGMGANGTVWLCEHLLDGNPLGKQLFAIANLEANTKK